MQEMWETDKRPKALQLSLKCDFRLEVVGKERMTGKTGKGVTWTSNHKLLLEPRKQKHWLSQSSVPWFRNRGHFISPKKTYRWLKNTWKDAQHHSLPEKCKSKPQWGTIARQSGWLLSNVYKQQMLERVWRKGNSLTLLVGMRTSTATMENSVEISQKTGNRTVIWPSNPTSGHTHRGN